MPREALAVVYQLGMVEVGVVDEAIPADGGAGLLELDAHDDGEGVGELVDVGLELGGILAGGGGVVDGAGADDDEQAAVAAGEDLADLGAGGDYGRGGALRDGELFVEEDGRKDDLRPPDPEIICAAWGVHAESRTWRPTGRRNAAEGPKSL
jgi:hypothetical protein